ncbi:CCA tRNA nucleotidyltransferase [Membranihabitans maritimus]|uniref:CCA tRNA nucleotidyltransferase n=1 Tax=Membranihabitans maritimus TaxID=2904244 RepID=UPI001F2F1FA8|nr:HD domain-containing protein [Membranihabitans maritimus]
MRIALREEEVALFRNIAKCTVELKTRAFVIGGFVRDRLLGRPSVDIDIVCEDNGVELAKLFARKIGMENQLSTYSKFGVAMVNYGPYEIEFVGARKESYSPDSRKPFVSRGTLEDDQWRRDFTINALGISLNDLHSNSNDTSEGPIEVDVVDPFDGVLDAENKIIRTPADPDQTFSDDPLRMLRGIRFASQLHFTIEEATLASIRKNVGRIDIVSNERISAEFNKIMASESPSIGLILLEETGLMTHILPELSAMNEVEFKNGKGHKNNFYHTAEVVDNVAKNSEDLWLRWAALLHDIGKPKTKRYEESVGWTFHGHEVVGGRMVKPIFRRMRLPLDHKMKFVRKLVRLHLRPIALVDEDTTDSAVRRLLFEAGEDIDDLMILCEADITSKNQGKVARYRKNYERVREKMLEVEQKDQLRNWEPPIDGDIIMKTFDLKPGKTVGIIKTAIREAILDGKIGNTFEDAHTFMIEKGLELGLQQREA